MAISIVEKRNPNVGKRIEFPDSHDAVAPCQCPSRAVGGADATLHPHVPETKAQSVSVVAVRRSCSYVCCWQTPETMVTLKGPKHLYTQLPSFPASAHVMQLGNRENSEVGSEKH